MNNSAFENLQKSKSIIKNAYRRTKNKLSSLEQQGYELFLKLVEQVENSERFLLSDNLIKQARATAAAEIDPPEFQQNSAELDFDACVAFSSRALEFPNLDSFMHFTKHDGNSKVYVYALDRTILKRSLTRTEFKAFLEDFAHNYGRLTYVDDEVTLQSYVYFNLDMEGRCTALTFMAAFVLGAILEKPDEESKQRHARISDCDYVRGPNGRYEAHNYYTYICEQADAQQFRNSVREKRQAHGFTGTGGTKAFHFRKAHWRYYQELGRDVFVRGYYAGRHKPEVNVIR